MNCVLCANFRTEGHANNADLLFICAGLSMGFRFILCPQCLLSLSEICQSQTPFPTLYIIIMLYFNLAYMDV